VATDWSLGLDDRGGVIMTLSKEIERTTLEEHKKANAGNSGNHYYYKQLSYKALKTVDRLEAKIKELESGVMDVEETVAKLRRLLDD
jgi:predicted RNase H-like nuclease (RuvC/YqgF family)